MKRAFAISLTINILVLLFVIGRRVYYSHYGYFNPKQVTSKDEATARKQSRVELLNSLPVDSNDVVFIGDSQIEAIPITEIFGTDFKNRGIAGDNSKDVLNRIDCVLPARLIYLAVGINDISNNVPLDSLKMNIERIAGKAGGKLIIQSVLPTSGEYKEDSKKVVAFNHWLQTYCAAKGIRFVDLDHVFTNMDSLTVDGLHLNKKGIELWLKEVKSLLNGGSDTFTHHTMLR